MFDKNAYNRYTPRMIQMTHRVMCRKCGGKGHEIVTDGDALRRLRKRAGLSLREVARRLELTAPFISDVELGRRQANIGIYAFYSKLKAHPRMAVEVRNGK